MCVCVVHVYVCACVRDNYMVLIILIHVHVYSHMYRSWVQMFLHARHIHVSTQVTLYVIISVRM